MSEIKRNAFRCKKCGMVVESKSVHDFEQCKCGNFTDGGLEYVRSGGKIEDMEDLSEPHMYFDTGDTVSGDSFGEDELRKKDLAEVDGWMQGYREGYFDAMKIVREAITTLTNALANNIKEGK